MLLESDEYVTIAEAARMLGVSRQRVDAMVDDGVLDIKRPWPMVSLVRLAEIEARLKGEQVPPVGKLAFRRWLAERYGITEARQRDWGEIDDLALVFTTERRPHWTPERRELWALGISAAVLRKGLS